MIDGIRIGGEFIVVCRNKNGHVKWIEWVGNLIVNEGLNKILDSTVHNDASATWYVAVFESDTTPLATHTYASPGYTECTAYDEATRPEYVEAAASGQSITNAANKAVFTFNAAKTIYGAALVNVSTKGDTAGGGVLLCSAKFSAAKSVTDDDTLSVTYILTASDDGV